jgi:hypothetical protein
MAVGMLPTEMSVAIPATERNGCCNACLLPMKGWVQRHREASCLLIIIRAICKHHLMSKSQGLTLQSSDTLRRWRPTREREREREEERGRGGGGNESNTFSFTYKQKKKCWFFSFLVPSPFFFLKKFL